MLPRPCNHFLLLQFKTQFSLLEAFQQSNIIMYNVLTFSLAGPLMEVNELDNTGQKRLAGTRQIFGLEND